MHTNSHTGGVLAPYLLMRNGSYYFNRRVPKHAVKAFGKFIRVWLSKDQGEAEKIAENLSGRLDGIWRNGSTVVSVDLNAIVQASKPQKRDLFSWMEEYAQLRGLDPIPVDFHAEVSRVFHREVSHL